MIERDSRRAVIIPACSRFCTALSLASATSSSSSLLRTSFLTLACSSCVISPSSSFCIDSSVDYQPLGFEALGHDLTFLLTKIKNLIVAWHDPNFGVRFNDIMDAIEESVPSAFNYTRATTIYGGSNEIQKNIIAKKAIKLPRK